MGVHHIVSSKCQVVTFVSFTQVPLPHAKVNVISCIVQTLPCVGLHFILKFVPYSFVWGHRFYSVIDVIINVPSSPLVSIFELVPFVIQSPVRTFRWSFDLQVVVLGLHVFKSIFVGPLVVIKGICEKRCYTPQMPCSPKWNNSKILLTCTTSLLIPLFV